MHRQKRHLQLTQDGATVPHTAHDTKIIEIHEYAYYKEKKTTLWKILICYCCLNTHFHKHSGQNRKYRNFGWRQISTVASIYIQYSSIHRYGMCLITNFSDHNTLPIYLSLHTIMICRFCEGPLLQIKALVGFEVEWIYGLLGVLHYSPRVTERATKLFLIMAHLSHNKSIFYEVTVEKTHCLLFCDSVKSASFWLQGQLAQTGHIHTINTDQRDEPHASCLLFLYWSNNWTTSWNYLGKCKVRIMSRQFLTTQLCK